MTRQDFILDIDKTHITEDVFVSSIDMLDFLGYCETMVLGGEYDGECERTDDRDSARLAHDRFVSALRAGEPPVEV